MAREKLYKNLKLSERMIMFLTKSLNYVEIDSRNKYRMFEKPYQRIKDGVVVKSGMQYLFVGKNGAVRSNHDSKNAANSFSYTDRFQAALTKYETDNNLI